MDIDKFKKLVETTNSKSDLGKLYFGYQNKRINEKINAIIKRHSINTDHWIKAQHKCLNCGKVFKRKGKAKFCNSSCSVSFNNKNRKHNIESRNKISKSLLKTNESKTSLKLRNCVVCEKEFVVSKVKCGVYSKQKNCSKECQSIHRSNISKKSMNKIISEGRHQGWMSRNKISYPEKFFMEVLDSNEIKYQHNFQVKKRDLGLDDSYSYFLDFFIEEKMIDLEIDGNQHLSRIQHDRKRDKYLTENNYKVYRIKWKSINSEKGKNYIKNEINKFLEFYTGVGRVV